MAQQHLDLGKFSLPNASEPGEIMADLKLTNVEKAYGEVKVLANINLDIKQGELIVFVGP